MEYRNRDEGMDCKKLTLLFMRKLWIVVLAAGLGAALGCGIYLLCHVVLDKNREYRAESKLYLDFAPNASEEVYQEYNGYTWNDLLSTDWILDTTMSYLPDSYTEEEVTVASLAEILSDLRLLTITVTTTDAERTAAILEATDRSLVELGKERKEFLSIEVIKENEPKLVTTDPRLFQAALVGGVLAALSALFILALCYVLDDKIYVPYDLKCATTLPFIGFSFAQTKPENKQQGSKHRNNEPQGIGYREKCLMEKLQEDLEQNRSYLEKKTGTLASMELQKGISLTDAVYENLRQSDGVLLAVSYGKMDRASLVYWIEQLQLQGCKPVGILIKNADMRFMKWYYNHL